MIRVNLTLFTPTALPLAVEVMEQTAEALQTTLTELQGLGFTEKAPHPDALPKVEHITGFVLGEANTKGKAGLQACVYLFNDVDAFTFKSVTVYEEKLDELPLGTLATKKVWTGDAGAAPQRATAIRQKFMYPCDFLILKSAKCDFKTGEPIRKTNPQGTEYVMYQYNRVVRVLSYPRYEFSSVEEAIGWGYSTKVLGTTLREVEDYYNILKEQHKPKTAQEMWDIFVAEVNSRISQPEE